MSATSRLDSGPMQLALAKKCMAEGKFLQAIELLLPILDLEAYRLEAGILIVRMRLQLLDLDGAELILKGLSPKHPEIQKLQQMIEYARSSAAHGSSDDCEARVLADPQNLEARYHWGIALTLDERYAEAMDQFLQLINKNKGSYDAKSRQAILTIFEVLGQDHALTISYRRKFANLIL